VFIEKIERIQYKIAVLSYKVLHDTAPRYLGPLTRVADIPGRRALRSASTDRLELGSTLFQSFHHQRPSFSGCRRLTDLEFTNRNSRFGINTAIVPAPIEIFFYFNDPLLIITVNL